MKIRNTLAENGRTEETTQRSYPVFSNRWQSLLLVLLFAGLSFHYFFTYREIPSSALVKLSEPTLTPALQELTVGEMETALARLQFDSEGQLVVDSQTEATLGIASEQLPVSAGQDILTRVAFLIGEQFAAPQAQQVEELFRRYYHYKQQELAWRKQQPAAETLEEEIREFEFLSELQGRELGPALADRLYDDHRRLTRYMFAARRLEKNSSLSAEEKQARLQQLQRSIYPGADGE